MKFYKRQPAAYLSGTSQLSSREHAVYNICLDLMYQHDGEVAFNPALIAGYIADLGAAAVRNTINDLIALGKLFVSRPGYLSNRKTVDVCAEAGLEVKFLDGPAEMDLFPDAPLDENPAKTEGKRGENSEKTQNFEDVSEILSNDFNANFPLDKNREEQIREEPPISPNRSALPEFENISEEFEYLWLGYKKIRAANKGGSRKAYLKARRKVSFEEIARPLGRYIRARLPDVAAGRQQYIPHFSTWLNGERWDDDPAHSAAQETGDAALDRLSGSLQTDGDSALDNVLNFDPGAKRLKSG